MSFRFVRAVLDSVYRHYVPLAACLSQWVKVPFGEGRGIGDAYESYDGYPVILSCCAHCEQQVTVTNHHAEPHNGVPREKIHSVHKASPPHFSVCCPCGHWTVVSPDTQNGG